MTIVRTGNKSNYISSNWDLYAFIEWQPDVTYDNEVLVEYWENGMGYCFKSIVDNNDEKPSLQGNLGWVFWNYMKNTVFPIPFPVRESVLFDYTSETNISCYVDDNENPLLKFDNSVNLYDFIGAGGLENVQNIIIKGLNSDDEIIFEKNIALLDNISIDWYDWTYGLPKKQYKNSFIYNLPMDVNIKTFTLEFSREDSDEMTVGSVVIGNKEYLQCTLDSVKLTSKSSKQLKRDTETGIMLYDARKIGGYKEITANVHIQDYSAVDGVLNALEDIKNTPMVFIADDRDNEELRKTNYTILGVIEEYSNTLRSSLSDYSITIKSM